MIQCDSNSLEVLRSMVNTMILEAWGDRVVVSWDEDYPPGENLFILIQIPSSLLERRLVQLGISGNGQTPFAKIERVNHLKDIPTVRLRRLTEFVGKTICKVSLIVYDDEPAPTGLVLYLSDGSRIVCKPDVDAVNSIADTYEHDEFAGPVIEINIDVWTH